MDAGERVGDRFELERFVGAGSAGAVWRARDVADGRAVAVKLVALDDARAGERFEREATLLASLRHPHIVPHVAHGTTDGRLGWLAMAWLDGEPLGQWLAREGAMAIDRARGLLADVADALGLAHAKGVVHRDVKPANLYLEGGRCDAVRLLDFGIARADPGTYDALTGSRTLLGTPGYMSPEQARGGLPIDARADVFALGAVAFECLTGQRAFPGRARTPVMMRVLFDDAPDVRTLRPEVPAALADLVARMLARPVSHRPADGAVVASALRSMLDRAEEATVEQRARIERVVLIARPGARARAEASTLAPHRDAPVDDVTTWRSQTAVEPHGGQVQRLADGLLRVTAIDAVTLAACALAIVQALPDVACGMGIARVATGNPRVDTASLAALSELATAPGAIRVDGATAVQLVSAFTMTRDATGMRVLVGSRS